MKIGSLEIKQNIPIFLAPMAGVTDVTYREICREYGANVTCTEMVSAKALFYKNKNTAELLKVGASEHPVAVQLFGSEPELMADIALSLEDSFDIIDINMGCPVAKIVNNGEGSALMKDEKLASNIVRAMTDKLKKPVTVKMRIGFSGDDINAVHFAKALEDAGASLVTVHGRTREQMYHGKADYSVIADVKNALSIPVVGNGDIFTGADAYRMLSETGADGVMVARGIQGNPWLLRDVRRACDLFEQGTPYDELTSQIDIDEKREIVLRHARGLVLDKGEFTGVREMRKHLAWYSAGLPGSGAFRGKTNYIETIEALETLVNEYFK